MTRTWHIGARWFAQGTPSGKGGLVAAGRWHRAGRPIIYSADSLALAALEVLVHARSIDNVDDLVARSFDIAEKTSQVQVHLAQLPGDWAEPIVLEATQEIGDRWLQQGRSAVLWVPSVHGAGQRNALLNPLHPDFKNISVGKAVPFRFDSRIRRLM